MAFFDFLKKKELNQIKELTLQLEKYKGIISIEQEIDKKNRELLQLNQQYIESRNIYLKLKAEISIYENDLESADFGIYKPVFNFNTSEEYKKKLELNIEQQKSAIKEKKAVEIFIQWTVDGSKSAGNAKSNSTSKLVLRAFNGECDMLVSKVNWNNIYSIYDRIERTFNKINSLVEKQGVRLTEDYLRLKLMEVSIVYEYEQKIHQEKEERKEHQVLLREEAKARREYEQQFKKAESDEEKFALALEKAMSEFDKDTNEKNQKLEAKIRELELLLKEAHDRKERALSMAQQTKKGHVYIISNIGSFGENVFKIGLTRRLEPEDRIRELGDASVPFLFDIHAMIFSDDAPSLEYALHKEFHVKKINMLNNRKEFFNITLEEIENKLIEMGYKIDIIKTPEAREYRETKNLIESLSMNKVNLDDIITDAYPSSLLPEELFDLEED